jgi:hypothetical protein
MPVVSTIATLPAVPALPGAPTLSVVAPGGSHAVIEATSLRTFHPVSPSLWHWLPIEVSGAHATGPCT